MSNYKIMYAALFKATTKAINTLQKANHFQLKEEASKAIQILVKVQQQTEEMYISAVDQKLTVLETKPKNYNRDVTPMSSS